jgi:hypothetical protein
MIKTTFWFEDIKVLYQKENLFEIVPFKRFDMVRKLNAILRLFIYFSLILFFIDMENNKNYLGFIPSVAALTWFIWNHYKETHINYIQNKVMSDTLEDQTLLNDLQTECRIPTKHNPFMNPNLSEYGNDSIIPPKSCPSHNNKGIQRRVEDMFNEELYRDVNDVFNKNNSQRQFYTVPGNQIPNDQGAYAQWLYGTPPTCKEGNQIACLSANGGPGGSTGPAAS